VGEKWATTNQWAPFNQALSNANTIFAYVNATVIMVDNAKTILEKATINFNAAVFSNGPGIGAGSESAPAVITITGLNDYANGLSITGGLFNTPGEIDISTFPQIYFEGTIQDGIVIMEVFTFGNDEEWIGEGLKYIAFSIETSFGMPVELWISKTTHDFSFNPTPTKIFNLDFKQMVLSITVEELLRFISDGEWGYDDIIEYWGEEFDDTNPTWKEFSILLYGGQGECLEESLNYEVDGILIRKDPDLKIKFLPIDIIYADTVLYTNFPFWILWGGNGGSWRQIPYIINDDDTLSFNIWEEGDGTAYPPEHPNCPRWVLEGTGGTFPIGKWIHINNNQSWISWINFDDDGYLIYYSSYKYNYSHNSDESKIELYSYNDLPYILEGNILIINPMGRGDGTTEFPPTDQRCDRWVLETETGEPFPIGRWKRQGSGGRQEWIEFTSDGEMFMISESLYQYELNNGSIMLRWANR